MNKLFSFADQVSIGDEVLVQIIDQLNPAKVINVSTLLLQGRLDLQIAISAIFSIL